MNWFALALLGWIALGLETGLRSAVGLSFGSVDVAPSFVMPLVILVAMFASAGQSLWIAMVFGLLVDLLTPRALDSGFQATVVGPNALGFMLAAQLTLTVRGVVLRRNPITLALLSAAGALVAGIVVAALLALHRLYGDDLAWRAGAELVGALGCAAYTAVSALVLSIVLLPAIPVFGFQAQAHRIRVPR